jgi:Na+/melibiose symporter-like transporter
VNPAAPVPPVDTAVAGVAASAIAIRQGVRYGALGLPLAFVALPLYVTLPEHYAREFGMPLATLGALLLVSRLFDAATDPFIGRFIDRAFAAGGARIARIAWLAAGLLGVGFVSVFFPPLRGDAALLTWCAGALAVTYFGYSLLSVLHQSWGARLGGDEAQRARVVSWREGAALLGVLVASVLPSQAGLAVTAGVFGLTLLVATALLLQSSRPVAPLTASAGASGWRELHIPLATPAFRRLLAVYVVNGVAAAIPATLLLFFVHDLLLAPAFDALFLGSFFAAAALSMPLWLKGVARLGLARSWLAGMGLSVVSFVWAGALGPGDVAAFTVVCLASGAALGADLVAPSALLAGVVQRAGHGQRLEGAYFGWWNFASKLNLALAAGLALPLLAMLGYTPGSADESALRALSAAYALLPCVLKLLAGLLLWMLCLRKGGHR